MRELKSLAMCKYWNVPAARVLHENVSVFWGEDGAFFLLKLQGATHLISHSADLPPSLCCMNHSLPPTGTCLYGSRRVSQDPGPSWPNSFHWCPQAAANLSQGRGGGVISPWRGLYYWTVMATSNNTAEGIGRGGGFESHSYLGQNFQDLRLDFDFLRWVCFLMKHLRGLCGSSILHYQ